MTPLEAIATTRMGKIEGEFENGLYVFKGVPYAAPPVGKRRWMPPEPVPEWEGIRQAKAYGPVCPQNELPGEIIDSMAVKGKKDEDCLYLNIWTPGLDGNNRPVMVWIHGGAFIIGAGSLDTHDGSKLARKGDVVIVTLNYRLGAFGFINLNEITGGRIPATGNEGLLDQIAALDWVRNNIESFGGDPGNITVFGESAGGMSIGDLMSMPAARGKFHKAIIESGTANTVSDLEEARRISGRFIELLGLQPFDTESLYAVSAEDLMKVQEKLGMMLAMETGQVTPFQPVVDGKVMPDIPIKLLEKGSASEIQTIVGSNLEESKLFAAMDPTMKDLDNKGMMQRLSQVIPGQDVTPLVDVYMRELARRGNPTDAAEILTAIQTDLMFGYAKTLILEAQSRFCENTFGYLFTWKSPAQNGALGACHALDIGFVFGILDDQFFGAGPAAEKLSEKMQAAWLAFAKTGNPSCEGLGSWKPYGEKRTTMILGEECYLEEDPMGEERKAWDNLDFLVTKPL